MPRYFNKAREKGRASVTWLEKHNLTYDSPPSEWIDAMFKIEEENSSYPTMFHAWNSWTNVKAVLGNVGLGGSYPSFKPLTVNE